MSLPLSRRRFLAAPLALAGCAGASPYFCRATPPSSQRLVHANGGEPSTLDPALLTGSNGDHVVATLLESLTSLHPITNQPAAALATHYVVEDAIRYTFFLRGHPSPRGNRLPNSDSLPAEFTGGRASPPDRKPALWSDGTPVTAHDFVYAWRRLLNPAMGGSLGFYLAPIRNADEVSKGTKPPEALAVRAAGDFALEFQLSAPYPLFVKLLWQPFLAAVPRHAVEAARKSDRPSAWTDPGTYLSSGPFLLREWARYDRVVVTRNPRYWDAGAVRLSQIEFLPIADGTANLHLYRAGVSQSMHPRQIPQAFIPALNGKKDFHTATAYRSTWYDFDVKREPLDRLPVRYAFSLATDRAAIASFLCERHRAATGIIPPMPGYPSRSSLVVSLDNRKLDLLGFDPRAARELFAREGVRGLSMELTVPIRNGSREVARIVQSQWRENLGVNLRLREVEETTWEQNAIHAEYRNAIEDSWTAFYEDPYDFLVEFGPAHYVATTWTDPAFDTALEAANRLADADERSRALFACEEHILRAMPAVPISFETWAYFQAPYLRGMRPNPFGASIFKYAWIDTHWRPS